MNTSLRETSHERPCDMLDTMLVVDNDHHPCIVCQLGAVSEEPLGAPAMPIPGRAVRLARFFLCLFPLSHLSPGLRLAVASLLLECFQDQRRYGGRLSVQADGHKR